MVKRQSYLIKTEPLSVIEYKKLLNFFRDEMKMESFEVEMDFKEYGGKKMTKIKFE